uniref:Uncharacterized protein n=1 Tax=uncultured Thiotrichaceae bacterium TaxID=298394 RepID=A0A6S6UHJ1_9GAMM|nr:MAG: Unknown protein [uncultured Thiotrichaceae bacterium]
MTSTDDTFDRVEDMPSGNSVTPQGFLPPMDYRPIVNEGQLTPDEIYTQNKNYLSEQPAITDLMELSQYQKLSQEEEQYYAKILKNKKTTLGTEKETDLLDSQLSVDDQGRVFVIPQPGEEVVYLSEDDISLRNAINDASPGVVIFKTRKYADEDVIQKLTEGMSPNEIAQACFDDLDFLARFLSPHVHIEDFPPIVKEMWKLVMSGVLSLEDFMGQARYALGMPRSIGKTQFIKYLMWATTVFTGRTFTLLITSIEDNGAETIKDVMAMMDQPHVIEVFGKPVLETDNTKQKRFQYCGKECIYLVKAIMSAARGLNLDERRPGLIILDDAQTEENAKSPVQSKALNAWIMSTLIPAGPATGAVVLYVGNTYMFEGSILTKLIKNPEWATLTIGMIKADGTSVWEAVHPIKKLLADFKAAIYFNIEDRWLAQFMNMTELTTDNKFKEKLVDAIYEHRFGGLDVIPTNDNEFNVVMIDPSGYKKNSDDVSIINMTRTSDGVPLISHHITKQMDPERNILEALSLAVRCGATVILVEGVAYQATLSFWMKKYVKRLNLNYMKIIEFHPGSVSKEIRITSSFTKMYAAELFVSSRLLDDYKRAARSFNPLEKDNKDDLLDIVASAGKLYYEKQQAIVYIAKQALLDKMLNSPRESHGVKRKHRV